MCNHCRNIYRKEGWRQGSDAVAELTLAKRAELKHQSLLMRMAKDAGLAQPWRLLKGIAKVAGLAQHRRFCLNKVINGQTKKQKGAATLGPSVAENLVDEFHIAPLGQARGS